MRRSAEYRKQLEIIFGRRLLARDGVSEAQVRRAEERLRIVIPDAMREFYLLAGAAKENREHNVLYGPAKLAKEGGYLVFMEENQAVVHWGVRLPLTHAADPDVWQRTNGDEPEWYSEEMPFSVFIVQNLAWQRGVELSTKQMQQPRPAKAKRGGPRG